MSTISQFMAEDHDKLDGVFGEFQKNKSKKTFRDFKIGLQRHIVWEEEILFPAFENKSGMRDAGPTVVMRNEHKQIKNFLEKIHDCVAAGETTTHDLEDRLLSALSDHNNKEEEILYPWIDNFSDEAERNEMFAKMKSLPEEKYSKCCG